MIYELCEEGGSGNSGCETHSQANGSMDMKPPINLATARWTQLPASAPVPGRGGGLSSALSHKQQQALAVSVQHGTGASKLWGERWSWLSTIEKNLEGDGAAASSGHEAAGCVPWGFRDTQGEQEVWSKILSCFWAVPKVSLFTALTTCSDLIQLFKEKWKLWLPNRSSTDLLCCRIGGWTTKLFAFHSGEPRPFL